MQIKGIQQKEPSMWITVVSSEVIMDISAWTPNSMHVDFEYSSLHIFGSPHTHIKKKKKDVRTLQEIK